MKLLKYKHYLLVGCFILFFVGNNVNAGGESSPLLLLTDSVKSVGGSVNEWTLHTRERLTEENLNEAVLRLQKDLASWEFTFNGTAEHTLFTAEHKQGTVYEKIQIVSPDTAGTVAYVLYSVTATNEKEIRAFLAKDFEATYSQIFHNTPQVYTCVKGKFDDKLEEVLPNQLSKLLVSWNAEKKEAISEKDFYSLSFYSKRFKSSIPLPNAEMNVQVGLRKESGGPKTNFVIGTPLITIEY